MVTIPTNGSYVDAPRTITATQLELKASRYDSPNIQAALEALNQDGFVVLKSVVDVAHIDHINSFMTKEADGLVKNNSKPFNQGVNCAKRTTTPFPQQQANYFNSKYPSRTAVEAFRVPLRRRILQSLRHSTHEHVRCLRQPPPLLSFDEL